MKNKAYNYNISELIDLISNKQIKETKFPRKKIYSNQLKQISRDLDNILKLKKIKINSKLLRKILFVGFSNLFVWETKDLMLRNKKNYYSLLQKSLEINVIRNSVTNSLMKDFDEYDLTRERFTELRKKNIKWVSNISDYISKN